jgi:HAD superfamily hydrolase (TIGR01509 family)
MVASPQKPAAVFFDLDGTLIESEEVWNDAVRHLAATRAAEASESLLARTRGVDLTEALTMVHKALGWHLHDLAADVAWVQRWVAAAYRKGVTWRPGARNLLSQVRAAGIPTALVTSSYRRMVDIVLDTLGRGNFDAVVCGDEVKVPKPDPEPYVMAARLLDVNVRDCVAIEDSQQGVASARAAGCAVLFVGLLATPHADVTMRSLADVNLTTLAHLVRPPPG